MTDLGSFNLLPISVLLILASQRIEVVIAEWFQNEKLKEWLSHDVTVKRGSTPTMVEWAILAWVAGMYFLCTCIMYGLNEIIFINFIEICGIICVNSRVKVVKQAFFNTNDIIYIVRLKENQPILFENQ